METTHDVELFLLSAHTGAALQHQIDRLLTIVPDLSQTELTNLAASLAATRRDGSIRAAIVAADAPDLTKHLEELRHILVSGTTRHLDMENGLFLSDDPNAPRIGFLFPGQGAPPYVDGGLMRQRFDFVDEIYAQANLDADSDGGATRVDQPAIITSSLSALAIFERLGITASVGIGHSLGELTALHWAGAMDSQTLLNLTRVRASAMSSGKPTGSMANMFAGSEQVAALFEEPNVFVAGITAPHLTVISGEASAVTAVVDRAAAQNIRSFYLGVPHAFHSPLIANEVQDFVDALAQIPFQPLKRPVVSTVTGKPLESHVDVAELLYQQVISTVQLRSAVVHASQNLDLFIEVGAGKLISTFAGLSTPLPAITTDVGGPSLRGLLSVVGMVFALGTSVQTGVLFADRITQLVDLESQFA